jgi:hypothetical protein
MTKRTSEVCEGPSALKRFREAMKTIVSVPKSRVMEHDKPLHRKRKPANRKG